MLKIRGRASNLFLLAQGRSRGLLLHKDFRDKATAIKAKVRVNHPKLGDTLGLLASQAENIVSIATKIHEAGLPSEVRIPELWDTRVQSSMGYSQTRFVPSYPTMGQGSQYQSQGAA